MVKSSLTSSQVSSVEYIDEAADLSRELTRMKARGPGDLEPAMRRIEREYGIDFWQLWQLRYRRSRIRSLAWDVVERIKAAHHCECERQLRKLKHELAITEATAGPDDPAVASAAAVVDETQAQQADAPRLSSELFE